MPNRTLYVTDEDERVWDDARALGGDESLSKLATEGLRLLLAERRAAEADQDDEPDGAVTVRVERDDYTTLVNRVRGLLRRYGWERVGLAYTKACLKEGAARGRAKRKAEEALGPEGRRLAAQRAQAAKGVDGRKAAARKAAARRLAAGDRER